jgi:hypothetical protein
MEIFCSQGESKIEKRTVNVVFTQFCRCGQSQKNVIAQIYLLFCFARQVLEVRIEVICIRVI